MLCESLILLRTNEEGEGKWQEDIQWETNGSMSSEDKIFMKTYNIYFFSYMISFMNREMGPTSLSHQ